MPPKRSGPSKVVTPPSTGPKSTNKPSTAGRTKAPKKRTRQEGELSEGTGKTKRARKSRFVESNVAASERTPMFPEGTTFEQTGMSSVQSKNKWLRQHEDGKLIFNQTAFKWVVKEMIGYLQGVYSENPDTSVNAPLNDVEISNNAVLLLQGISETYTIDLLSSAIRLAVRNKQALRAFHLAVVIQLWNGSTEPSEIRRITQVRVEGEKEQQGKVEGSKKHVGRTRKVFPKISSRLSKRLLHIPLHMEFDREHQDLDIEIWYKIYQIFLSRAKDATGFFNVLGTTIPHSFDSVNTALQEGKNSKVAEDIKKLEREKREAEKEKRDAQRDKRGTDEEKAERKIKQRIKQIQDLKSKVKPKDFDKAQVYSEALSRFVQSEYVATDKDKHKWKDPQIRDINEFDGKLGSYGFLMFIFRKFIGDILQIAVDNLKTSGKTDRRRIEPVDIIVGIDKLMLEDCMHSKSSLTKHRKDIRIIVDPIASKDISKRSSFVTNFRTQPPSKYVHTFTQSNKSGSLLGQVKLVNARQAGKVNTGDRREGKYPVTRKTKVK